MGTDNNIELVEETNVETLPINATSVSQSRNSLGISRDSPYARLNRLTDDEIVRLKKNLVRKLDMRLMPLIILIYILNYLDRNNIASASLAGLTTDLKLVGNQYQVAVSIFFVGYLLMQVPSNLLLDKLGKPSLYLPGCMIIWGLISALTSLARNYTDLLVIRFFLGFIEAAYFPGCLFYLSSWYTKEEISFRTSLMYSGSLLSGAFGGLIAAGILNGLNGARGIAAWQWLFIIEGVMTIFVAFCAIFILPNFPATTSWLTEDERAYATWRLAVDGGKADDHVKQSFKDGFIMAITDAKTYVLMLLLYGFVSCGTVTTFFPIVVKTLGYGNTQTLLLTAPPYILGVITTFANALHSDYTKERFYHVCLPPILAVFAFSLAAGTTSTVPRYISMMLMIPGIYTGYVIALGWISTSIPRPPAKRAAALALVNAFSNLCSVYMSFAYQSFQGPRYTAAMITNVCTALLSICMAVILRYMLIKDNKKLEQEEVEHDEEEKGTNKGFRYIY